MLLLLACANAPTPLPSAQAGYAEAKAKAEETSQFDRSTLPPLYRQLYDYAFLPNIQSKEQRVRILIWLKHMEFSRYQLGLLEELWEKTNRERTAVVEKQRAILNEYEPKVGKVYDDLWQKLQGEPTDAELEQTAKDLAVIHTREAELLELRARSIRSLLEAQTPFLKTLSPQQEIRFQDSIFLLRHRLDPYANPGDFNALIGTIYVAGDFGTLTRPTYNPNEDHLNIGGLWSENPEQLTGPYFPDARREVILYMILLEPDLLEALRAAESLKSTNPGQPGEPPPGQPTEPPPGQPTEPPPGQPAEPPPGQPAGSP